METVLLKKEDIKHAANLLKKGNLVAFPTETVYGLGADATKEDTVKKVYQAKGRPSDNPVIVHIAKSSDIEQFVTEVPLVGKKLMDVFWPGSLTLIFPVKENSLPKAVTGNLSTVAFRMPANQLTLALIEETGFPIVGPSANTSGRPSPTTAEHVYHDLKGKISGILDDGPTRVGLESTVLDLSVTPPTILRPGVITQADIEEVIGSVQMVSETVNQMDTPRAPGMKYQHYAPSVSTWMVAQNSSAWEKALAKPEFKNKRIGLLASRWVLEMYHEQVAEVYELSAHDIVDEGMKHLFAGLRALDNIEPQLDIILVQEFAPTGKGLSYMNRLSKAASGKRIDE